MKFSLFGKQLLISLLLFVIFMAGGMTVSHIIIREKQSNFLSSPPVFYSKLIEGLAPEEPEKIIRSIEASKENVFPVHLYVVDEKGRVIAQSSDTPFSYVWNVQPLPTEPNQVKIFPESSTSDSMWAIVRLTSKKIRYLAVLSTHPHRKTFLWSTGLLLLSMLIASGLSLLILFSYLRKKAKLADSVISEIQSGNLKARFPVGRMDEVGNMMIRFNSMADEIERLFERVKVTEESRAKLLQQLSHDLHTPVASLKSLLETLRDRRDDISKEVNAEFLTLSIKEVEYFERLVKDLLFLAQVHEPKYRNTTKPLELTDLLSGEIESVQNFFYLEGKSIRVTNHWNTSDKLTVLADAHLLRRTLRNGLQNAFSFAKQSVSISAKEFEKFIEISIVDDGPGVNQETISSFGQRHYSRRLDQNREGRLSVGLGSVIMKAVVDLHQGKIDIRNQYDRRGIRTGCELIIALPVANNSVWRRQRTQNELTSTP
ncbi:MAG: hypothetical protein JWQ35_702 [Bacteriovoracaceae bacterium]|nr:hypothetical protein [Bacteriovoracaceae bacterium]